MYFNPYTNNFVVPESQEALGQRWRRSYFVSDNISMPIVVLRSLVTKIILPFMPQVQRLYPWYTATSNGFLLLLQKKYIDACKTFAEALGAVQKASGKEHPHHLIAKTYSFMGMAAFEDGSLHESLRYFRR